MSNPQVRIRNKKSEYAYFLVESFTAGIVLTGSEIKSIREGKANLADAYCQFKDNELFVINMHIAEYTMASHYNHEPKRERKLLLTRRELKKLMGKVQEKGFTIIPTVLYINDKGLAKLEIALARGKHFYDKRESIKDKDLKRELDRSRRHGFQGE
ncbi:MAG TPA: SsrA-binding protein SmpB [Bacteroidales bacterium]|nr:SsrA-binding protein SmpB [Bacteroidales bacterium]HRZ76331.1 SsrA-binding protein SmpB [Bacteroidales bacterium]